MSLAFPQHAPHAGFDVVDDCLQIGARPLTRLAEEIGRTPFYAYDRARLTQRIELLRRTLPTATHLHYAIKANPMPEVVRHLGALIDGLDVASAGELRIALASGVEPRTISFAGPGKGIEELREAVLAGVTVNLESETEMQRLATLGRELGRRPFAAVRVNPDFELKTSGMKMCGGPKQFGIDAERVPQMLADLGKLPLQFVGFHIFSGSQNLRADAICEAQRKSVALAIELARHAPGPVQLLNIGGGFGIPYFPGEAVSISPRSPQTCASSRMKCAQRCRRPSWCSSSVATSSARLASMCAASSIARSRADRCFSSRTAVCIITSPPPATSAR